MSFFARIESYQESLTAVEGKIADFLRRNANDAVKMSIHELAAAVNVAPSSITRFVRRLGYKSFSEMRIELVRGLDDSTVSDFQEALRWSATHDDLNQHFIRNITLVCAEVLSLNEMDRFAAAAAAIDKAEAIYLFGVGTSSLLVQDLQHKLLKLRKKCIYNMDGNMGCQNALTAGKNDVVIAASYGGNTAEVNLAVRQARENGSTIITITRFGKTELATQGDICLYIPYVEQVTRIVAIFSRYAQSFLADILFFNLAQVHEIDPAKILREYKILLRPQGE